MIASAPTTRTNDVNPDALFLPRKAIGEFVGALGKGHPEIEAARQKAERAQYLLVALDDDQLKTKNPDGDTRKKVFFGYVDSWKDSEKFASFEKQFIEEHPSEYKSAKALVDARKGLGEGHAAVPMFGQIMGSCISDRTLLNLCVGLQLAGRIFTFLNEPLLEKLQTDQKFIKDSGYAAARAWPDDSDEVKIATQRSNDLNIKFLEGTIPKTLEEQIPYMGAALNAIDDAKRRISPKYASLVETFDKVFSSYYNEASQATKSHPSNPDKSHTPSAG